MLRSGRRSGHRFAATRQLRPRQTAKTALQQQFGDGASRTRTGGLLGAIQGARALNVAVLHGFSGAAGDLPWPELTRSLRDLPKFWHGASAWQNLGRLPSETTLAPSCG